MHVLFLMNGRSARSAEPSGSDPAPPFHVFYGEFRDHVLGRIAWVGSLHPQHGRRLREVADRIEWEA